MSLADSTLRLLCPLAIFDLFHLSVLLVNVMNSLLLLLEIVTWLLANLGWLLNLFSRGILRLFHSRCASKSYLPLATRLSLVLHVGTTYSLDSVLTGVAAHVGDPFSLARIRLIIN